MFESLDVDVRRSNDRIEDCVDYPARVAAAAAGGDAVPSCVNGALCWRVAGWFSDAFSITGFHARPLASRRMPISAS